MCCVQVLAGGRIGPANPPAGAAANGDAYQQPAAAVNGSSNGAPMTPTRMTRQTAAAMAATTADGSSSSSGGQFYPPTVIVGVTPDMDLYHEEVFGPVSTSAAALVDPVCHLSRSIQALGPRAYCCWSLPLTCYPCDSVNTTLCCACRCWACAHCLWCYVLVFGQQPTLLLLCVLCCCCRL